MGRGKGDAHIEGGRTGSTGSLGRGSAGETAKSWGSACLLFRAGAARVVGAEGKEAEGRGSWETGVMGMEARAGRTSRATVLRGLLQ